MLEIKKEMSKVLANIKLPSQIHNIIEEIYKEYQYSYGKLIEYLKNKYPNKEKEITKLEIDTLSDYKEDIHMEQTIEFEEYEQQRVVILEAINNILKYMKENKEIPKRIFENDIAEVTKHKQSEMFTKIVISNAIGEINSSSKYLINKIKNLELKRDEELESIQQQFLKEIEIIKENAINKAPEINRIINEHFKSICEQLKNIIQTYETEIRQEKVNEKRELRTYDDER